MRGIGRRGSSRMIGPTRRQATRAKHRFVVAVHHPLALPNLKAIKFMLSVLSESSHGLAYQAGV